SELTIDKGGRLTRVKEADGKVSEFEYRENGTLEMQQTFDSSGKPLYDKAFDANGNLRAREVFSPDGKLSAREWYDNGKIDTEWRWGANGKTTPIHYDADGKIQKVPNVKHQNQQKN